MADDTLNTTPTADPSGTPDAAKNTVTTPEKTVPYTRFKELNDKFRQLEEQVKEREKAVTEAQQKALAEQGEYKKLYEDVNAKLPTLEANAAKAEALEKWLTETLKKRLEAVPEHIRALLEKQAPIDALQWMEDHAEDIKPSTPGSLSNRNGQGVTPVLTDDELAIAKMMGVSPESYARAKQNKQMTPLTR